MKKIVYDGYDEMSRAAADILAGQLKRKPESVLGLATGSTPLGLYDELVKRYRAGEIDFSKARSFNLDEYYPIKRDHPQSYNSYMRDKLLSKVNFLSSRLFDGETADPQCECAKYDREIEAAGGIDLQLLGLGLNGHIGFNEPAESYSVSTHLVELTESTLAANSRFFSGSDSQPTSVLTMGLGAIFSAKSILLLISGKNKAPIVKRLFDGGIHTDVPACLLLLHPNVTVLIDRDAAGDAADIR
ncbi:MAG: glucosamine-6-phosphate deaminase [Oscillospiraceae bacterium]|jgi:glucosamine-6-phosphate deaminase|nr:glucosamine-6-phosphate deaminase [Oscillospiraceae bacterium]